MRLDVLEILRRQVDLLPIEQLTYNLRPAPSFIVQGRFFFRIQGHHASEFPKNEAPVVIDPWFRGEHASSIQELLQGCS